MVDSLCLFFFFSFSFFSFYCYGLINFKIIFLSCILIMLEFLEMFERKNCYEFFFFSIFACSDSILF